MIHILPYLEHTIRTTKTPQEIHDIMQSVTAERREWFSSTQGEFIGTIEQYDFKIMSNIFYHNDFLPVIKGAIKKGEGSYVVDLKMQPNPSTYVFLIIWFGFCGFWFLTGAFHLITSESAEVMMVLEPCGCIVFGQILSRCWFYFPAKKAIKRLEELFNGGTPAAF